MATERSVESRGEGTGSVLSAGLDVLFDNPVTVVVAIVAGFLSQVPLVGGLLRIPLSGFIVDYVAGDVGFEHRDSGFIERVVKLVVGAVVAGVAVAVGLLLVVVPGLFLALKFALFAPAVMVGEKGPVDALKDSYRRTTGNLATVFGVSLVLSSPALLAVGGLFLATDLQTVVAVTRFQRPLLLSVLVLVSAPFGALNSVTQVVMYDRFEE